MFSSVVVLVRQKQRRKRPRRRRAPEAGRFNGRETPPSGAWTMGDARSQGSLRSPWATAGSPTSRATGPTPTLPTAGLGCVRKFVAPPSRRPRAASETLALRMPPHFRTHPSAPEAEKPRREGPEAARSAGALIVGQRARAVDPVWEKTPRMRPDRRSTHSGSNIRHAVDTLWEKRPRMRPDRRSTHSGSNIRHAVDTLWEKRPRMRPDRQSAHRGVRCDVRGSVAPPWEYETFDGCPTVLYGCGLV